MQPMPPLAAAADAADNELQELVSQLVGLKVGPAAACVALARSLAEEGVMSLEDLRRLPSAEACKLLLRTAGMKELQVIKVVESYSPSPTPAAAVPTAPTLAAAVGDARDSQTLWLKGCLILEACAKGLRPFVGAVMQRLHVMVVDNVKQDIFRALGACPKEEWDCSACAEAMDAKFVENSPIALTIRDMQPSGVADCGIVHNLKPNSFTACRLQNVPHGLFTASFQPPPDASLYILPDPATTETKDCSAVILLHAAPRQLQPSEPHAPWLHPFAVARVGCSEPELRFDAVMCCSRPGYTAQLVKLHIMQHEPPAVQGKMCFRFWSLACSDADVVEIKHGLKKHQVLRFHPDASGRLPPGISQRCRYLVAPDVTDFSFNVCGPIINPTSPFTSGSLSPGSKPLVAIRTSPPGRLRDAARSFHSKGLQTVHWSGIRAQRLSGHHGEFCKLFCSHTSRDVDFFHEDGARSGEQLLNMIGMCSAFSINEHVLSIEAAAGSQLKPFLCTAHSSPPISFHVVASALDPTKPAAADHTAEDQAVKLWMVPVAGSGTLDTKLPANSALTFADVGHGLPANVYTGCRYYPTYIQAVSFQLLKPDFRSLFDVDSSSHNDLRTALEKVRKGAVGQPISKGLKTLLSVDPDNHNELKRAMLAVSKSAADSGLIKADPNDHNALKIAVEARKQLLVGQHSDFREPGAIDIRNRLCHNLLTLSLENFDLLVANVLEMFHGVCNVFAVIGEDPGQIQQCITEIQGIAAEQLHFDGLTEQQRRIVTRQREQLLEERDRLKVKLARKFDFFAPCLKSGIQEQLVAGNQLGRSGGQGTVYRVQHTLWGRAHAVKIFHATAGQQAWQRELSSLTFLTHPNIVRVYYIVYETLEDRRDGRAAVGYVMEAMARSAAEPHAYTLEQLLNVFQQIALALAFAHEQGVVHFDVKPENILLDDAFIVAKVCDFDCALKLQIAATTATSSAAHRQANGTPLYMAPEAFREGADFFKTPKKAELCDIYSFGKTMWKLLHPSREVEINRAFPVTANVPVALKELVEQCTLDDATRRPQSMKEVLAQLMGVDLGPATDILWAAERGDLLLVSKILAADPACVNKRSSKKETPLHFAAWEGHADVIQVLVDAGAQIDATDKEKYTPLHYSAEHGHLDAAKALLKAKACINARGQEKDTPLHSAAWEGHADVIQVLVDAGAQVDATDKEEYTPLHYSAERGHLDAAKSLLKAKACINARGQEKDTPLHLAAWKGDGAMCRALAAANADVASKDKDGSTPLALAKAEAKHFLRSIGAPK